MAKDDRIALRLPAKTKTALARAAAADERTLSWLVEKIVTDWLEQRKLERRTTV